MRSVLGPGGGEGERARSLFLLGLLGVPRATLGLAERTDGRIAVYLLVARQTRLHRRGLLSAGIINTQYSINKNWPVPSVNLWRVE